MGSSVRVVENPPASSPYSALYPTPRSLMGCMYIYGRSYFKRHTARPPAKMQVLNSVQTCRGSWVPVKLFCRAEIFDWPASLVSVTAASGADCRSSLREEGRRGGPVGAGATRQNSGISPENIIDGRILANGTMYVPPGHLTSQVLAKLKLSMLPRPFGVEPIRSSWIHLL